MLAVFFAAVPGLDLVRAWRQIAQETEKLAAGDAYLVERHVARTVQTVELSLRGAEELLDATPGLRGDPEALRRTLADKLAALGFVRGIALLDTDGAARMAVPDEALAAAPDTGELLRSATASARRLLVHAARQPDVTGRVQIPVTWRMDTADGRFDGLLVANLDPLMIAGHYETLDLGKAGIITVLKDDGTLVARMPPRDNAYGRPPAAERLIKELLPRSPAGTYRIVSGIDGIERIIGYRHTPEYGLVVLTGIDVDDIRARWMADARVDFLAIGLYVTSIAFITVVLARVTRERERALSRARASEERFRDYAEIGSDWVYETDDQFRFTYISSRREQITGTTAADRIGKSPFDLASPEEQSEQRVALDLLRRAVDARQEFRGIEFRQRGPDGQPRWVAVSGRPRYAADGRFLGYRGAGSDLTRQKQTELAAVRDRTSLVDAIESLRDGFARFDQDDRLVLWNTAFATYYPDPSVVQVGRPFVDFARFGVRNFVLPHALGDDAESWVAERVRRHRAPGEALEFEHRDGRWDRVTEYRTQDGGIVLLRTDITELKTRQRNAERLASQQRALAELSQKAWAVPDAKGIAALAVQIVADCLDLPVGEVLLLAEPGDRFVRLADRGWPTGPDADAPLPVDPRDQAGLALARPAPVVADAAATTQVAPPRPLAGLGVAAGIVVKIAGGPRVLGVLGVHSLEPRRFHDDEVRFVEASAFIVATAIDHWDAIRQRQMHEARLDAILNALPSSIALVDGAGTIVEVNRRWEAEPSGEALFGPTIGRGANYREALRARTGALADAAEAIAAGLAGVLAGRAPTSPPVEYASQVAGRQRWYRTICCAVSASPTEGAIVIHLDVTDRRQSEEALAQSRRLEAVGQLTGGLAHDFNNLLTVILGQSDLLADMLAAEPEKREMANAVLAAAQRGADLIRQMLAFARRQPLQPSRIDPGELIEGLVPMLQRTLTPQIELRTVLAPDIWPCLADRAQLESALLNLVINARDAMGEQGALTIETANATLDEHYAEANPDAHAGDYVVFAVSDTGSGMTADAIRQAFEPFFTTKPVGQGTGLGLSMVYGFVRQTGGHAKIYSEVGRGTTVKLYLPRTHGIDADQGTEARGEAPVARPGETVLLVEDDDMVRLFAADQLKRLGYEVLLAPDGPAALEILGQRADIHVLFTDIVMPGGVNGLELARAARALRPGIKVLLTSGYPAGALANGGNHWDEFDLLVKPYQALDLARRLRAALDRA